MLCLSATNVCLLLRSCWKLQTNMMKYFCGQGSQARSHNLIVEACAAMSRWWGGDWEVLEEDINGKQKRSRTTRLERRGTTCRDRQQPRQEQDGQEGAGGQHRGQDQKGASRATAAKGLGHLKMRNLKRRNLKRSNLKRRSLQRLAPNEARTDTPAQQAGWRGGRQPCLMFHLQEGRGPAQRTCAHSPIFWEHEQQRPAA